MANSSHGFQSSKCVNFCMSLTVKGDKQCELCDPVEHCGYDSDHHMGMYILYVPYVRYCICTNFQGM